MKYKRSGVTMSMPTSKLNCLHGEWFVNGTSYNSYTGYLSAKDILELATVPSFGKGDKHTSVAQNIQPYKYPVVKWQRPEYPDKITDIAQTYSDLTVDNIMPNPVILCQNTDTRGTTCFIKPSAITITSGSSTVIIPDMKELEIKYPSGIADEDKPLWILDGQHRIKGMMHTSKITGGQDRSDEKIPFILLSGTEYQPRMLAEIFTHVTSGATAMDAVHKSWMHYSFKIKPYDELDKRQGLECATNLCVETDFPDTIATGGVIANIFENRIQYNPKDDSFNGYNAFYYTCESLGNQLTTDYYSLGGTLPAIELAQQINAAVRALEKSDSHHKGKLDGSVLFGSKSHEKGTGGRRVARAYISGILRYLRNTNSTGFSSVEEWHDYLTDAVREFDHADWRLDFVVDKSGGTGNKSLELCSDIFEIYLSATKANQPGTRNSSGVLVSAIRIEDYLQGTGGQFMVERLHWDYTKDRKIENKTHKAIGVNLDCSLKSTNFSLSGLTAFRITSNSPNVYIERVLDAEKAVQVELPSGMHNKKKAVTYEADIELTRAAPGKTGQFVIYVITKAYGGIEYQTQIRLDA